MSKHKTKFHYLASKVSTVFGIVLVWRGVWTALDLLDKVLFNGSHLLTAFISVIIGLLILYIPDKTLKDIEKL